MRDIKFRAWSNKSEISGIPKGMYFNCGISFSDCGMSIEFERPMIYSDNWQPSHPAHFFKIMQYTGLKDKNGKEIYEGDIITYRITRMPMGYAEHEDFKGFVEYINGAFWTGFEIDHGNQWNQGSGNTLLKDVVSDFKPEKYSCEIIGNIYENPEILNK